MTIAQTRKLRLITSRATSPRFAAWGALVYLLLLIMFSHTVRFTRLNVAILSEEFVAFNCLAKGYGSWHYPFLTEGRRGKRREIILTDLSGRHALPLGGPNRSEAW